MVVAAEAGTAASKAAAMNANWNFMALLPVKTVSIGDPMASGIAGKDQQKQYQMHMPAIFISHAKELGGSQKQAAGDRRRRILPPKCAAAMLCG
jgi:hypothetical protein